MKTHVLRGSKQEIADSLIRINGNVHEAIVFEDEPATVTEGPNETIDLFDEMGPYMVDVEDVDDSRETIYTRMEGD